MLILTNFKKGGYIMRLISKMIAIGFSLACLSTITSQAFAYQVDNQSWYQQIWVKDTSNYYLWNNGMGPHQVNQGGTTVCDGSKSGCDQGAIIEADIGQQFNSSSNTQNIQGCNVSAHGELVIKGGGPNPLYCTGG
jgi:hypothetical protein